MHNDALIIDGQLLGFNFLLEVGTIKEFGWGHIAGLSEVQFPEGDVPWSAAISINESDFNAKCYHHKKVEWMTKFL